jgi:hypothetical protein
VHRYFILNAKFLGLLRTIAGSGRLVPIEQAIDEVAYEPLTPMARVDGTGEAVTLPKASVLTPSDATLADGELENICFYIAPIGEENSEQRQHADFMMTFIIDPR